MKVLKQYWIVLLIILATITAVFVKGFSRNSFRYDAVKRAEPSVNKANIITPGQTARLPGDILWIDLDGVKNFSTGPDEKVISIPADSILTKTYKKLIFKHKGSIVIKSADKAISAGVWMILAQMGIKNVYILN